MDADRTGRGRTRLKFAPELERASLHVEEIQTMIARPVQTGGRCAAALLVAAALAACGHEVLPPEPGVSGTLIFQMDRAPSFLATATITVTGPGISPAIVATAHLTNGGATDTLTVLAGANRHVLISAFDSLGGLSYRGDTTINVTPGPNPTLSMTLQPLSGGVGIVITFNPGTVNWTQIVVGNNHACGLTSTGATYCWGADSAGIPGWYGAGQYASPPVLVPGGLALTSLTKGGNQTCGLTAAGIAYCWGRNEQGSLGDGTTIDRATPVAVAGGLTFTSLVGGEASMCGLTASGTAYCWGRNDKGQVGDGTTTERHVPVAVAGGLTFASLAKNDMHTCGLTSAGAAYCWGWNVYGQIGDGTTTTRSSPVAVSGSLTFTSLVVGGYITCGITSGGTYCWGEGSHGQLGTSASLPTCFDGYASWPCRLTPIQMEGGLTFTSLVAGNGSACGLTASGAAYCWGYNFYGEVGDGSNTDRYAPVAVAGGLTFARLSPFADFSVCGVTTGGAAYCWGYNPHNQLGDGTTTDRNAPVAVVNP